LSKLLELLRDGLLGEILAELEGENVEKKTTERRKEGEGKR